MPSNTHDPKTVATVAEAMRAYDEANTDEDGWFACSYPELAVAALDALTELGWRPPLTEQEPLHQAAHDILMALDYGTGTNGAVTKHEDTLRALLSGGRHE